MLTATELRQDIYQKLDEVIATQEPLLIERKGNILKIIPLGRSPALPRLSRKSWSMATPMSLFT
jgi:hypothetical protein